MTEEEVRNEGNTSRKIESVFMMATEAYHILGDLSSEEPDLMVAHAETDDSYIGNWVTGLGFINVCFPKKTTRSLTAEEVEYYNEQYVQLGSHDPIKLKVD